MHILIIPSWYATPKNPLRGSFFREQALALHRAGHRVGLLVPPSKLRTWNGLDEVRRGWRMNQTITVADDAGMPTYRLWWWGWMGTLLPEQRGATMIRLFDRYVSEQGRPDVIHAHSLLYGGFGAAHIRRARGVPVVLTENSSSFVRRLIFPDQRWRAAFTLRNIDVALAVNAAQAAAMRSYAPEVEVDLIQNSTNVEFFTPGPPPPASPFTFAIIAGLNPNKGVDILLRAFSLVFRGEAVQLKIVGDGAQRGALEQLTQELDLQQQVTFLGSIPREGVRDVLRQVHCVVSASYFDMMPFNLIEALACGKPIVATRSDGAQVLVNASNGILVPTGDVPAMAAALHQMRDTYAHYNSAAIREACVARYSDQALLERLEQIYTGLLTGK